MLRKCFRDAFLCFRGKKNCVSDICGRTWCVISRWMIPRCKTWVCLWRKQQVLSSRITQAQLETFYRTVKKIKAPSLIPNAILMCACRFLSSLFCSLLNVTCFVPWHYIILYYIIQNYAVSKMKILKQKNKAELFSAIILYYIIFYYWIFYIFNVCITFNLIYLKCKILVCNYNIIWQQYLNKIIQNHNEVNFL